MENAGKLESIHLWKGGVDLDDEMDVVISVAESDKEKLAFLACYFSLQMLHLNLRSLDVLQLKLTGIKNADQRLPIYKNFMLQTGKEFRTLTAAYMRKVFELFSKGKKFPEFTILGVGSLAHQDDIDVGVVDDGSENREELNLTINKLNKEMFKWATELHFYLSEHVGSEFYTASIHEYRELLDKEIQDFIIISEMLSAVPIFGSTRLFRRFNREITLRYHYQHHGINMYHEGYLRGILGEIRSFLFLTINTDRLNPKDDALRMLSGMIFSGKTIFRIYKGNRWEILAKLMRSDPTRKQLYVNLEKALTFLETFRHVYQLYVGLEEDIYLDNPEMVENLQKVAKTLGYQDMGAIKAWDHLLIHYHEYVELAKETAAQLLEDVREHIKSISSFTKIVELASKPAPYRSYPGNLAIDFLKLSNFYKGTKFWDDILDSLKDEDSHLLQNFVDDIKILKPKYQKIIVRYYGVAFQQALYPTISFLNLLAQHKHKLDCVKLSEIFNIVFLKKLTTCSDRVLRLTKVFSWYPELMNAFLTKLTDDQQYQFWQLLNEDLWDPEQEKYKELLVNLCEIHINTSRYFKRFFSRIISEHPIYIEYLKDIPALEQISKGILGTIDSLTKFESQKNQLNRYHDLEFLRVGLEALNGAPIERIDNDFTEFSDNYLQMLFDICKQEVMRKMGKTVPTRDLIAIYAAGGHAREQAFDDDYDIIVLLNENDEEIRRYCNKIIIMMNCEIMKRGTMPHYRFADHFGSYITLVDELDTFLAKDSEEIFIDKSQLLGSRLIVGSRKFQKYFEDRIIKPHIYEKSDLYIEQMINEMTSRQHDKRNIQSKNLNLKEGVGGLRDIEILLLIYKAKYQISEPLNRKLVEIISKLEPENKDLFFELQKNRDFLKRLRDLYRLTVSAGDMLKIEYLNPVSKILGYRSNNKTEPAEKLVQDYSKSTARVHQIVEKLLKNFE